MFIIAVCCVALDAAPVQNAPSANNTGDEDDTIIDLQFENKADTIESSSIGDDYEIEDVFFDGNTSNNTESNNGEDMILFEGDIIISLEELRK